MRYKDRFKVKRLFVLGAGASYSATTPLSKKGKATNHAPLDSNFLKTINELEIVRPAWIAKSKKIINSKWLDKTKSLEEFGLEEAIIRQLGHIEFVDEIDKRKNMGLTTKFDYLNHLSHLIAAILIKSKENSHRNYKVFVSKVFPSKTKIDEQRARIITFNYDCLIDKYLTERFKVNRLYFDRVKENKSDSDIRRASNKFDHPILIKLHGSINWRCSTEEFKKIIDGHDGNELYKIESIWLSDTLPNPGDSTSPLIMPPLPVKPITDIKLFQFLWTKAYEYLHEAEEMVICGYSLPETDRLAMSLFSNFKNNKLNHVTVVDPNPEIMKK